MIGLDTNVIVRYIMQDDVSQAAQATRVIERLAADEPGFLTIVTIVELAWVFDACYDLTREQVGDAIEALLRTKELVLEDAESVLKAVRSFRHAKADFADCLIAQKSAMAGCARTLTFDRLAAKHAGMQLIA